MIHIDGCRTPARIQARRNKIARTPARQPPFYRRLLHSIKRMLNQKGDPTLIKCTYCQKVISDEDAYEAELIYMHGSMLARKKHKYCSKQCASYNQMAHES